MKTSRVSSVATATMAAKARLRSIDPVPTKLVDAMKKAGKGKVYDLWQKTGGKKSGTWPELFGWEAGEIMTSWSIANYIENIAESAKVVYDIPMFINVWMMEQRTWPLPGEAYPSGWGCY